MSSESTKSQPESWSHPTTSQRAFNCLAELDWPTVKVADVGAGRGHFSYLLGEHLRHHDPRLLGGLPNHMRLKRKHPDIAQSNWETLTSRTTILRTRVADRQAAG